MRRILEWCCGICVMFDLVCRLRASMDGFIARGIPVGCLWSRSLWPALGWQGMVTENQPMNGIVRCALCLSSKGLFEDRLVVSHDACRSGRCWPSRTLTCVCPSKGSWNTACGLMQHPGCLYLRGKAWFLLILLLSPPRLPASRPEPPGSRYDI